VGAVVGTIALIAIPSLIFGFWPQIRKALREPASTAGPGLEAREDPLLGLPRAQPQAAALGVGLGLRGLAHRRPVRRVRRARGPWQEQVGEPLPQLRPAGGERTRERVPLVRAPRPPAPTRPRRCRSCGAAESEYHDPGRCTDQAALLQQAITLTRQLIQMKQDEVFVKTGHGRDEL
jgi:hypothetical protein